MGLPRNRNTGLPARPSATDVTWMVSSQNTAFTDGVTVPTRSDGPGDPSYVYATIMLLLLCSNTFAQSEARYVGKVSPLVGQRGRTIALTIVGENLNPAAQIHFYRKGLRASNLQTSSDGRQLKAQLRITANCPVGQHPFRVRTAHGWTTMSTFYVTAYPVDEERKSPSTYEDCQAIKNNSTVVGFISKVGEVDYYRMRVKKGQRVSVDMQSVRLAQQLFDGHVAVFDDRGKLVAENDDSGLGFQDPMLSVIAPSSGEYRIAVRESGYGNEGSYKRPTGRYLLHAGSFPRTLCIVPAGGKPGRRMTFSLLGDARGTTRLQFVLPPQSEGNVGKTLLTPSSGASTTPTPHPIRLSHHTNIIETEPNNDAAKANRSKALPDLAFNGVISKRGDVDMFQFRANKGDRFLIEAYCRRLRSRMDPVVSIHKANGDLLASNDDASGRLGTGMFRYNTHHSSIRAEDSLLQWQCDKTANYLVSIRDHLRKGGVDYHYRVELSRAKTKLNLWVKRNPPYWRGTPGQSISVPRGNRYAAVLSYRHLDGKFPIRVSPKTLPQGVRFSAPRLDDRRVPVYGRSVPMLFEAEDKAPLRGTFTRFTARTASSAAKPNSLATHYEQSTFHGLNPPNYCFYGVDVDRLAVCVAKRSFIHLEMVRPVRQLVQNGRVQLQVRTKLDPSFKRRVHLELLYLPPGISATKSKQVPLGKGMVPITVEASAGAVPSKWPMCVVARVATQLHGGGIATSMFPLAITRRLAEIRVRRAVCKPGHSVVVIADVLQPRQLPEKTFVQLRGLPAGAKSDPVSLKNGQAQVKLKVTLPANTPARIYRTLFCDISIKDASGIVQRCADGGILHVVE